MNRLDRITFIYNLLKQGTVDTKAIQSILAERNLTISLRQIQRDIHAIQNYLLQENELLTTPHSKKKKNGYRIVSSNKKEINLKKSHVDWYFLGKAVQPKFISLHSTADIQHLERQFSNSLNPNFDPSKIISSHFYEGVHSEEFQKNIENIFYAISNSKHIKVGEIFGDYTSIGSTDKLNNFIPSSIIFHRGNLYLAGIRPQGKSKKIMTFEVGQLKKVQVLDQSFQAKNCDELVQTELKNRFGISQNINNKTYSILLEFTPLLGDFIMNQHWHHSQSFKKTRNTIQMSLNCGINRELLGWLFQWMSNVRIIEPPELKKLYNEQLELIQENLNFNRRFVYSNNFIEQKHSKKASKA